jgi:hypothetical protein
MPATITVIFEHGGELAKVASADFPRLLFTDDSNLFHLSELDDCSYDIFTASDMPDLIRELTTIRSGLERIDAAQVDAVISLCKRCQATPGSTLAFTPFDGV